MNNYGFAMKIEVISQQLRKARLNAGVKAWNFAANGNPKPMTQVQAADEMQISRRKLQEVENMESNFSNPYYERRAIAFIERYSPRNIVINSILNEDFKRAKEQAKYFDLAYRVLKLEAEEIKTIKGGDK